jgi:membrane protein implicated in regulation of membrane protease activity
MSISDNILDRDKKAYKENTTDGGLDRRVTDIDTQAKLDEVKTAIENLTFDGAEVTITNEVEVTNDVGNPIPVSISGQPIDTNVTNQIIQYEQDSTNDPATGNVILGRTTNSGRLQIPELNDDRVLKVDGSNYTQPISGQVTLGDLPIPVSDNGGSLTIDGTVSVSGTVTVDTELPAAAALADTTVNPTVPATGAFNMGYNGTTWDRLRSDTANGLDVDVTRVSGNVTVVQATAANLNATIGNAAGASAVNIQDGGNSITVDGSITANQGGTWNINNISGTVSLPTGAATEVTLAKLTQTQGSTTAGQSGPLTQAAVSTSSPIYTNGQTSPLSLDTAGFLRVTGTVSGTSSDASDGQSTSSSNVPTRTRMYQYNGASWDRVRGDITNGIDVDVTRVSGNVTVVQPTGTNLHTVIDSGTITTVTTVSTLSNTTQLTPGTSATNLGKAEDAAHTTGDVGVMSLAVRNDAGTALAGTTLDYIPLTTDSNGKLWTSSKLVDSTNADLDLTTGGQTGVKVMVVGDSDKYVRGAQANDSSQIGGPVVTGAIGTNSIPTAVTDGNVVNNWADLSGRLHITGDASMTPLIISDGFSSITVDGSVTVSAGANDIGKREDVASANADVGVPAMAIRKATPINTSGTDGDYEMLQMSAGRLWTSATIDAALPTGSNVIGALTANQSINLSQVNGNTTNTGAGASGTGTQRVITATDSTIGTVTNLSQLNGASISMNTGVRDAGTQRVTIATNDVVPISDNAGSITVDNAGTFAVQATIASGASSIAKAEDSASANLDVGIPAMAIRKATPANTSDTDGDYEMLQISAGRLWTSSTIDAALPTGSNVIGALTANQSVNVAQINGTAPSMGNGASGTGVQRVTIANDSTGILATVGTVTNLSQMSGQAIAMGSGVRSSGTQRVTIATDDIVPASQSGTWTVQPGNTANTTAWLMKLSQTGTDNDVDVASVIPGTGATNLGKAEDAAHTPGDTGVMALGVRNDANASLTNTDLDYSPIATNIAGHAKIVVEANLKTTYMGSTAAFTPPATPTDMFYIAGSGTKTIKILKLWWSSTQNTAGVNTWFVIKRSTANTLGTAVATTKVPNDSNNAAATATVQHYTANPTLGTSVGNIFTGRVLSPATATTNAQINNLDFNQLLGQPLVLRGTAEGLSLNFNGAALPAGLSMTVGVMWTEE